MRQLPNPGRLAAAFAASLAIAASAGCMSVSDDKGEAPEPRKTSAPSGGVIEPEGGQAGPGRHHAGGGRADAGRSARRSAVPEATPSPRGVTTPPAPKPTLAVNRPQPPEAPEPTEPAPTPTVPLPTPTQEQPSEPPEETPSAQPTEPTDPPAASPPPEVHAGALRMAEAARRKVGHEPESSPQVGAEVGPA
ncbi:hypothetical protein ABZ348_11175 [Streptomyces sp. NPDC005963]|uniref:hypothetical protein n=1 Tax=Streptomyces sp. NPDC005963 TaxID=3156721 RepID=UPI0033C9EA65